MFRLDDGLWIGGYPGELPRPISAVLSLCETPPLRPSHHHEVTDELNADPDWLARCVALLEILIAADEEVYLHCLTGRSMSPTVAASFLSFHHQITIGDSLAWVRRANPVASPSPRMLSCLRSFVGDYGHGVMSEEVGHTAVGG